MMTSSLLLQIIKLLSNIYISNKISTEALGIFHLIMATYGFGITIASSGLYITCMKIVSEELALNNNSGIIQASKKIIAISFLFSSIASFIFLTNSNFIVKFCFESKVNSSIVFLICIALPLISFSSAISGYFMAVRRIYKTVIGQFLEQIAKILAIIFLFKVLNNNSSLQNICFILILGDLISEIVSFTYLLIVYIFDLRIHFLKKANFSHSEKFIFRILRVLFPISITSCIRSGISTFKQLLIPTCLQKNGKFIDDALSDYGIISGMAMPIVLFPASFLVAMSSLLIPEFSRYYVKEDYHKIKIYTDKLIAISFIISCFLAIFFLIFGNNLGLIIYHNNEAGIYIKLFSLLIPFMYVDIIIDNILKGLDAQSNVMIINILDLIVSTLFIVLFVPLFGIKGYILSIFISEILNLSLSLNKLLKLERSLDF